MRNVHIGNGRIYEVPTTHAEGAKMITNAVATHGGRGSNAAVQSACARVAYGLFCNPETTPDPTDALAQLLWRLCMRKPAEVEK